jgi:hypothetical protein
MTHDRDLPVPPEVEGDPSAVEVVRAWVANESLVCALRPTTWQGKPRAWGMVLADLARHVANALQEVSGDNKSVLVIAIRDAFNDELSHPTDHPSGGFV